MMFRRPVVSVPLRCACLLLAVGMGLLARWGWADEQPAYQVGIAAADITPDYPIRLNGFGGRRAESEGVDQRIWAKALAISDGQQPPFVLVAIDNLGVRWTMVDEVARRLLAKHGIPRERFALTFSHSHCTPKVNGAADTIFSVPIPPEHQRHIDRYTRELTDKLEQVAESAIESRQPSTLAWGIGSVGFAKNRRTEGGPVDHDLPVLVVRNVGGDIRAIYVSYACHCVTLSFNRISGDWAGFAQESIQKQFPGSVALVSIGCGSDANPSSGVTGDRVDIAAAQGEEIGREVARLVEAGLVPVRGPLAAHFERIELPLLPPPTRDELTRLAAAGGPVGFNAEHQLAQLARGQSLPTHIDYPTQTLVFGDSLAMVFLAGEVCVDYSIRLKSSLNRDRIWINGYSNDFCAYIPSERLLREGGYGGGAEICYFALPNKFQAGLEDKIVAQVMQQVPAAFHVPRGTQGVPPQTPADSLQALRTHERLRVELVASEPLVADPVAIDFGPDGRLWVAEMLDYARGPEEQFSQSSRIRVLQVTDGDGKLDRADVFLEGLRFPTDVKVWRKGILVCDAPDIIYAEDTDGDGRADVRKTLYTGFATHNAQARVNSLRLGLDNWWYGSGGLFGGHITSFTGAQADVTGRDFRLRPDTGAIEAVTGKTQQGRVRDDWGHWFGCTNGDLLLHYPVEDRYFARNPRVVPPPTQVSVAKDPDAARLHAVGQTVRFKLSGPPGSPTSACGVGIYRDSLLGDEFYGNSFTCEPVHQLVHRLVLRPAGMTFTASRADDEAQSEFLASTDRWFRPVQARTGPDGALWIVDMYRYVIEHPVWIPEETKAQLDVFAGRGMGRIYRVLPRHPALRPVPRLDRMATADLVPLLASPNGTLRDMVHEQLLWRNDPSVAESIERLFGESILPASRLQALCVLDGLHAISARLLEAALHDSNAVIQRHAVRITEGQFINEPAIRQAIVDLANESHDAELQQQLAYALGFCDPAIAAPALAHLARLSDRNVYLRAAVMSSLRADNVGPTLVALLHSAPAGSAPDDVLLSVARLAAEIGDRATLTRVVDAMLRGTNQQQLSPTARWSLAAQVLEGVRQRRLSWDNLFTAEQQPLLQQLIQAALRAAGNGDESPEVRRAAVALLGCWPALPPDDIRVLTNLLAPQIPADVQASAFAALRRRDEESVGTNCLEIFSAATPEARNQILDLLLERPPWCGQLLDAISAGHVTAGELDPLRRGRLLEHSDPEIRRRAATVLSAFRTGDRAKIVAQFAAVERLSANAERGRAVFGKRCATCHRLEGAGHAVGPDLAALSQRSLHALLVAILDPSRDVDGRYQNYVALQADGRQFSGIIAEETATSLTLLEADEKRHVLLRADLELLRATGKSLMPDGLEQDLQPQDLADLMAYVIAAGPPPKFMPGNVPKTVAADTDGRFELTATAAEIFGGEIVFEQPFQNIGYWHGEQDRAGWRLQLDRPGTYEVYLDYACADDSAGNQFRLDGGEPTVTGVVTTTGGWDQYRRAHIGSVTLAGGQQYLTLRPLGKMVRPALLDLHAVLLIPKH